MHLHPENLPLPAQGRSRALIQTPLISSNSHKLVLLDSPNPKKAGLKFSIAELQLTGCPEDRMQFTTNKILENSSKKQKEGIFIKAVAVELDYKGEYVRFALTFEDFFKEFSDYDIPLKPAYKGFSATLSPLVHVWYILTEVNSDFWQTFFSDMEHGLPLSDIEIGNLAYVSVEKTSESLKKYVEVFK